MFVALSASRYKTPCDWFGYHGIQAWKRLNLLSGDFVEVPLVVGQWLRSRLVGRQRQGSVAARSSHQARKVSSAFKKSLAQSQPAWTRITLRLATLGSQLALTSWRMALRSFRLANTAARIGWTSNGWDPKACLCTFVRPDGLMVVLDVSDDITYPESRDAESRPRR